ncbi:MAG: TIM barrel protein [Verrucomicrobiota bacterium]
MDHSCSRRSFLKKSSFLPFGLAATSRLQADAHGDYPISLAQWSLHRALRGGELDNLDWAQFTKDTFDIHALEYVNQFFAQGDRKKDRLGLQPKGKEYLLEMNKRTVDLGMTNVLIMCDGVGQLGNPDDTRRGDAVEGHVAWLEAANHLGCHAIRVNAASDPNLPAEEQEKLCADGLRSLSERASQTGLSVIVENHGGLSSDGAWLASVMKRVDLPNCGTLPDFGNFYLVKNRGKADAYEAQKALYADRELGEDETGLFYDRYQGIRDLMPYAKGVSAKAHDFDEDGNEIHTDFTQAMALIKEAGYTGYIGVEYEGKILGEVEGIRKTKALIERVLAA